MISISCTELFLGNIHFILNRAAAFLHNNHIWFGITSITVKVAIAEVGGEKSRSMWLVRCFNHLWTSLNWRKVFDSLNHRISEPLSVLMVCWEGRSVVLWRCRWWKGFKVGHYIGNGYITTSLWDNEFWVF